MVVVHPRLRRALAAASAVAICLAAATIKSALVTARVDACGLVQVAGQPPVPPIAHSTRPDSWVAAGPFARGLSPSGWVGSGFLYEETDRAVYRDLSGVVIQLLPTDSMPGPACSS